MAYDGDVVFYKNKEGNAARVLAEQSAGKNVEIEGNQG